MLTREHAPRTMRDAEPIRPILGRVNDKARAYARAVLPHSGMHVSPDLVPQLRLLISALEGPKDASETVSTAFDRFQAEHCHRLRASTQAQYRDALVAFASRHGDVTLGNLSRGHVETFLRDVARGSVASVYSALSSAFGWLGLRGLMPECRPKSKRREAYLNSEQLGHWIAALSLAKRYRWARVRTIEAMLVATLVPFRRGELVSLKWRECDLGLCVAQLEDSKTGPRWVPLGKLGAAIIASQPRVGDYVFTPPRKTPTPHITGSSLAHAFKRVTERYAEMKGHAWPYRLCFYSLRHSWCSLALVTGESHELVRRIMGHSSNYMTQRYSHVIGTELGASMDRVQDRLAVGLPTQLGLRLS